MNNKEKLSKIKRILIYCQFILAVIYLMASLIDVVTNEQIRNLVSCRNVGISGDQNGSILTCIIIIGMKLALLIIAAYLLYGRDLDLLMFTLSFPFVLQAVFMPGVSAYLIAMMMLIFSLYRRAVNKRLVLTGIVAGVIILVLVFCNSSYNKKHYGLGVGLMNNYALTNLQSDYYYWPEDIKNKVSYELMPSMDINRSYAIDTLGKYLGNSKGNYERDAFRIAFASIKNRTKESVLTLLKNTGEYVVAPLTVLDNCEGYGESITGSRIEYLLMGKPVYGVFYLKVSIIIFLILAAAYIAEDVKSCRIMTRDIKIQNEELQDINKQDIKKRNISKYTGIIIWCMLCGLFANTAFDYMLFVPVLIIMPIKKLPDKGV